MRIGLWRLRYRLGLCDLAEMFLERGFAFAHETVRWWEATFAPRLTDRLRRLRYGRGSLRWHRVPRSVLSGPALHTAKTSG
jgi:transposase-like protein